MKLSALCAVCLASAALTGCAASEQVYDKNYVRAVAVAGESGKAAVFAFYDESAEPYAAIGDDLPSVQSEAELGLGKSIFTGHTELIVLGECDYAETLEFMLNEWKVSPSCLVVYGGPYSAYALKNFDAETLADSVRHANEQGKAPECDIVTVLSGLLSSERSAEVVCIGENGVDGTSVISEK